MHVFIQSLEWVYFIFWKSIVGDYLPLLPQVPKANYSEGWMLSGEVQELEEHPDQWRCSEVINRPLYLMNLKKYPHSKKPR